MRTKNQQQKRHAKLLLILENEPAIENGLGIISPLPKYFATEENEGSIVWGFFSESLENAALSYASSETSPITYRRVYNLDTEQVFTPVFKVERWIEWNREDI